MAIVEYNKVTDELYVNDIDGGAFVSAPVTQGCDGCVFHGGELAAVCDLGAEEYCWGNTRGDSKSIIWIRKNNATSIPTQADGYTTITTYRAADGTEFSSKLDVEQYVAKQKFTTSTGYEADAIIAHRKEILELLKNFE